MQNTFSRHLAVAKELEKIALEDEYFVAKKLYPNVDFYSGIVLSALGFPTSMFTVLFALARTVGWISQWNEMLEDPSQRIGRPRQLYSGAAERNYVPISPLATIMFRRILTSSDHLSIHSLVSNNN